MYNSRQPRWNLKVTPFGKETDHSNLPFWDSTFVLDGIFLFGDILGTHPRCSRFVYSPLSFAHWFIQNVRGKSLRAFWGDLQRRAHFRFSFPSRDGCPIYGFLISLCSCQLLWHVHPVRACSGHTGCIVFFLCPSPTPKRFDFARGSQGASNRTL